MRAKRKKLHCAKTRGNFSEPKRAKNKGLFYNASSICCFFESIQFKKCPSEDQVHKKCGCSLKKQKPEGSETSLGKNNLAFSPKNLAELALRGCCIATFKLNSKDCVAYGFKYRTFVYTANAKTPSFNEIALFSRKNNDRCTICMFPIKTDQSNRINAACTPLPGCCFCLRCFCLRCSWLLSHLDVMAFRFGMWHVFLFIDALRS